MGTNPPGQGGPDLQVVPALEPKRRHALELLLGPTLDMLKANQKRLCHRTLRNRFYFKGTIETCHKWVCDWLPEKSGRVCFLTLNETQGKFFATALEITADDMEWRGVTNPGTYATFDPHAWSKTTSRGIVASHQYFEKKGLHDLTHERADPEFHGTL